MKVPHIELLKCIECEGHLALSNVNVTMGNNDSIERGVLHCLSCGGLFPIIDYVGIFFRKGLLYLFLNDYEKRICADLEIPLKGPSLELTKDIILTKQVTDKWSYQWNNMSPWTKDDFEKDDLKGELCFRKFIRIDPEEYTGKKVVVWCGGNGREAYHISKYNPRLLIVNEIGDEIYRINGLIDRNIDLLLLRCDMLQNPLRSSIADISICDHALQHIIEKERALHIITDVLVPGGTAAICVYSYENNFLMTRIIEPLKSIIHRMTIKNQEIIALIPAVLIFLLIHLIYLPADYFLPGNIKVKIPLFKHMMFWSRGSFKLIRTSCFDLIHAPVSYHFKKNDLQEMAKTTGLYVEQLVNTHDTTWSMTAKKQ